LHPIWKRKTRIEDHPVLRDSEDVLGEIPGLSPKIDIEFSIDLVPGFSLMYKTPYIMGTP
jgi:hypothetical protein